MEGLIIKKGRPLLNYVILTADRYTAEELAAQSASGIIRADMEDRLKDYQRVVSISERIKESSPLKEGDLVLINLMRYAIPIQKKDSLKSSMDEHYNVELRYNVPMITIDGKDHLKLGDNDIEFIVDEYEFAEPEKPNDSGIILPSEPNILLN